MPEKSSPYTKTGSKRLLYLEEKALIHAMLSGHYPESKLNSALEESTVEEMLDGGMGSIRFVGKRSNERHLGRVVREAKYADADGVPVLISINLDQDDVLFEVDFWKVDYSRLLRYPTVGELDMDRS